MKQRRAARLAWALGAISVAAVLAGVIVQLISPQAKLPPDLRSNPTDVIDNLTILGLPIIGALVASRRSDVSLGWMFLLAGLGLGLSNFGQAYATYGLVIHPGSLLGARLFGWLQGWSWTLGIGAVPFLLLLFPTGQLQSRRWRPVAWLALASWGVMVAVAILVASFLWSNPLVQEIKDWPASAKPLAPFFVGSFLAVVGLSLIGFVSAALRFKNSRGDERQQLKWFVTAAAFFVAIFLVQVFVENAVLSALFSIASVGLWAAIGIAILKYRLYDVDIVINKAVVFGALAAFFTAVYVAIVVGIGALVGSRANTFLTVAAAVLIAVAFQPVRERARHLANRLVYGPRATPYEVLSQFSERVAGGYATEDLPARMAQILGDGTGATRAVVWLEVGAELRPAATWPDGAEALEPIAVRVSDLPAPPEAAGFFPVRHQDELLGALSIHKPPNEPLTPAEEKLVSDLASQAGLVLRNVRLIEELRASRQRLVKAQDEERRRLERNIHDGAQQQLVAPGIGGGPRVSGPQGRVTGADRNGWHLPVPTGGRSRCLLLHAGGAAERGEVRRGSEGRGALARRGRRPRVRGHRRRSGVRPGRQELRERPPGDGRPLGCAGRRAGCPIRPRRGYDRHRATACSQGGGGTMNQPWGASSRSGPHRARGPR